MPDYISVRALALGDFFSDDCEMHLPWFQRAYAWSEEMAIGLYADLVKAMGRKAPKRRYSLGTIWLAKKPDDPSAALIDGNQRAMTISILFALLRDMAASDAEQATLAARLIRPEPGKPGDVRMRLHPQIHVADFFKTYVQMPGGTLLEPDGGLLSLSESERCILNNRNTLRDLLSQGDVDDQFRGAFADFLATGCNIIVKSVEDEDEAWAMLATEQKTASPFNACDRAKISLISVMPRAEQPRASLIWEEWQGARLGVVGMQRLLEHVRTLRMRHRSSKPVEENLIQRFELDRRGLEFMTEHLVPQARIYQQIKAHASWPPSNSSGPLAVPLPGTIFWLDHELFMPPAMRWVERRGSDVAQTQTFLRLLDRLTWIMKIAGFDHIKQERRFISLLDAIDSGVAPNAMAQLVVEDELRRAALSNLRAHTFETKHSCFIVLRRLEMILGADPGPREACGATTEHILPRSPAKDSAWLKTFGSKKAIEAHANKLGNLVFLSFAENQKLGNADYDLKQPVLKQSPFVLARRASLQTDWTQATITGRTEELIGHLFKDFDLPVT